MDDLLGTICGAIARQEGWFEDNAKGLPRVNHNPGNLRAAPWLPYPPIDPSPPRIVGGYWFAEDDAKGISGLYHQVALNIARGMNLRQLLKAWAPASDKGNNESVYLRDVMEWTGIGDPDVPLRKLMTLRKVGA